MYKKSEQDRGTGAFVDERSLTAAYPDGFADMGGEAVLFKQKALDRRKDAPGISRLGQKRGTSLLLDGGQKGRSAFAKAQDA